MKENAEKRADLKQRTKSFALRIVRLFAALPKKTEAQVSGEQLLRSGTSVGAHYREARSGRRPKSGDFGYKARGHGEMAKILMAKT